MTEYLDARLVEHRGGKMLARRVGAWVGVMVVIGLAGSAPASAQVQLVAGDGGEHCPGGWEPMSVAHAQANQSAVCQQLGQWVIARLAGGGSMDGPGYRCQIRPRDDRGLGHTLCVPSPRRSPPPPQHRPPPPPPSPHMVVPTGTYDAIHPRWGQLTVVLAPDGTYQRSDGRDGAWRVDGHLLVIVTRRGEEFLSPQADGSFRGPSGFTLTPRRVQPPPPPPPSMQVQAGVYDGIHPHWRDTVTLAPDGTYRRGNGDPGRWYVEGHVLVLDWQNWGAERLHRQPDGSFRAPSNGFTLRFRAAPPPPPPPPPMQVQAGVYDGVHPHWRDTVTLAPDGTYRRGNGDPGRWYVEGRVLVLDWQNWGAERLHRQPDGSFRAPSNGFTLTYRGPAVVVVRPGPDPSTLAGLYDAVHPRWRGEVRLRPDGSVQRGARVEGRWTFDGSGVVITWTRGNLTERLALQPDGSLVAPNGFTLRKRVVRVRTR
ncbi:MAG: hypothetical protein KF901_12520 [Myxococcales bacterium]|nr:hypothetical protein [Myxococcales bacterium]